MTQTFHVSLNTQIHDKPPDWNPSYADDWQGRIVDQAGLMECVAAGYAFIPAAMNSGHRRSEAFVHADLAVADIDEGLSLEEFDQHPLAEHALFIYTTSSHRDVPGGHRFRAVFRLPRRVSDPEFYKAIVTLLIQRLGGDKSCSDPCRLFYGNSKGTQKAYPGEPLSEVFLSEALELARQLKVRYESSGEIDEIDLGQAEYVLEHVLEPTADGERDRFIRITAAAASAGSALYAAWSDWASRGHHGTGKNRKQTSERFFQGFSGRSSLATLFYLAGEDDPDWRKGLPPELRRSGGGLDPAAGTTTAGYDFESFLGSEDDLEEVDSGGTQKIATMSMLDFDPSKWDLPKTDPGEDEEPEPGPDPDPEFMGSPDDLLPDPVQDGPLPKRRRGRPRKSESTGSDEEPQAEQIRKRILGSFPDLRLNLLNLGYEYGSREQPKIIADPADVYVLISRDTKTMFPKTNVMDTLRVLATNRAYNPVLAYLEHCKENAEPIDYLDRVATELLGAPEEGPDNPRMPCGRTFADLVMRRFLVGAVARALEPGCGHSWMPILVGAPNVGKTNFFQYLTPPDPLDGTYPWTPTAQQGISYFKERPHALHIGWIVLLDEVERFFKRQYTEELKNLVSVPVDVSARKWENERRRPRAFVLAGASNSDTFMVDPTGNRRFMPIRVLGKVPSAEDPSIRIVDLDRVKLDRDRIWAAAYQAYLDDPVHEFSSYEITQIGGYVDGFSVDSPILESLKSVLGSACSFLYDGRPAYLMKDIYEKLGFELNCGAHVDRMISDEMIRLGYRNVRRRVGGEKKRFWIRPSGGGESGIEASSW